MDRIRQKIKELRELLDDHNYYLDNSEQALGYSAALDDIEEFLDTLSEEPDKGLDVTDFCKPIDPGIAQCVADHWWEMLDGKDPDKSLEEAADEMAIRAFPEKKSYSTVYDRVVDYNAVDRKNYRDGIIAGAEWQKSQMLKDAIYYVVQDDLDSHGASYNIPFIRIGTTALKPKGIGVGDKVRIIVLKAEE